MSRKLVLVEADRSRKALVEAKSAPYDGMHACSLCATRTSRGVGSVGQGQQGWEGAERLASLGGRNLDELDKQHMAWLSCDLASWAVVILRAISGSRKHEDTRTSVYTGRWAQPY